MCFSCADSLHVSHTAVERPGQSPNFRVRRESVALITVIGTAPGGELRSGPWGGAGHGWEVRARFPCWARVAYQRVNRSKAWLKYQVSCAIPEQELEPAVPTHPPLSRCSAQKERVLMPLASAHCSTFTASWVVKVS